MQKAFIAIALALTLTSVASFTAPDGTWVKTPVPMVPDADLNYTNNTRNLELSAVTSYTDLNLVGSEQPECDKSGDMENLLSCTYKLNYKAITPKDLSSSKNSSYTGKAAQKSHFGAGYAYALTNGTDSNSVEQYIVASTKLEGAALMPQIVLTSNKDKTVKPKLIGAGGSKKSGMVFISYNETVNFTSFTLGSSNPGKEFKWTGVNATKAGIIACGWGEALSSSQCYAGYKDDKTYKVGIVDFGSGTIIKGGDLGGFTEQMTCEPYATDKKLYGVFCRNTTSDATGKQVPNMTLYASSANTTLSTLYTITNSTGISVDVFPYAGYIALITTNASNPQATTVSKEIWDLEANKNVLNKTVFLTYNSSSEEFENYRVEGAGHYGLLYNTGAQNRTNVKVGQFMAGSSLTTVFAFLMTIVAGLFLF